MGKRIRPEGNGGVTKAAARLRPTGKIAAVRAGGGVSSPATVTRFLTVTATLTSRQVGKRREEAIVTETATTIVTALGEGPTTARALSQRLDGNEYATIRQTLHRLAKAGTVTKVQRGVYALGGGDGGRAAADPSSSAPCHSEAARPVRCDTRAEAEWTRALAGVWADFGAMDDPHDPRAWA